MGKARIIIQMLMLANNRALRWSLASSVLSPLIGFWNNLTVLQTAAVVSALVLTIGAVVEYWYKLKQLAILALKWTLRKSTPFERCVFKRLLFHSIGPILVVLGIAGEVVFEGRTFVVEDTQEEQARKTVGSLKEQAERADEKAKKAITDSSTALDEAEKSKQEADTAGQQAYRLRGQLANEEARLTGVDEKRAELEKSLTNLAVCNAPRVLLYWNIGGKKSSIDPLKSFAGYQAIIDFVPNDAEARRAALNIYNSLKAAGWQAHEPIPGSVIPDGVTVQPFEGPSDGSMWGVHIRSSEAADTIVDFLHSFNWQASKGFLVDDRNAIIRDPKIVPPDGLRIRVGLYPAIPFVAPPGEMAAVENRLQWEQEREQAIEKNRQEHLKNEEQYLKTLTPQQQIEFKARREESKKQIEAFRKLWTERFNGPCKPQNPLFLAPGP